ncbi:MAG: hypothetical protein M9952_06025 [Microthrixaceae bacterium]|nr:hypothetical protein [Microthrixaceae bacterium]MCO5312482.1 hypothetical protein [Microthrixaceae bacterium]HPB44428.1 hypothetical protein [Microthrixaceae bacterium]
MLDHVFTDAIGALRDALERALLERQALEERFQSDVLLGDLTWETSYSLPGEGAPPRIQVDLSLAWPTWSQTAYRSWYLEEELDDPPHIDIEIVVRIQRLSAPPDPRIVLDALPTESPPIGGERLHRSGPTLESAYSDDLEIVEHAIEVSYDGSYELDENVLADGGNLDTDFAAMGGWISATLVRLGDLAMPHLPTADD